METNRSICGCSGFRLSEVFGRPGGAADGGFQLSGICCCPGFWPSGGATVEGFQLSGICCCPGFWLSGGRLLGISVVRNLLLPGISAVRFFSGVIVSTPEAASPGLPIFLQPVSLLQPIPQQQPVFVRPLFLQRPQALQRLWCRRRSICEGAPPAEACRTSVTVPGS